ncbi:hypothetical protein BV898_00449 [Hypsibius exemplaris]|uniref:G-protein coupled receptors family 1 profile domain-containing protein n=1 Tax=Hypsibius exemplaris TaxID=2072580 RepID=A0A1W0XDF8_HYPEX|nr:hypothetical protein BV898_00449 [Hypsibius exemplaris]
MANLTALQNITEQSLNCTGHCGSLKPHLLRWSAVLLATSVFGVISNGVLLGVIGRSRTLRSGTGILISHVVVAQLLMCAVHFPVHVFLVYGKNFWSITYPAHTCTYAYFPNLATVFAIGWSEATLAVNRLIATVCPYHYPTWTTRRVGFAMVAACWVISCGTLLPFCFGVGGVFGSSSLGQCAALKSSFITYSVIFSVNAYAPYTIVGVIAVTIICKVCAKKLAKKYTVAPDVTDPPVGLRTRALFRQRLNLAGMLFVSFLFSVVCSQPVALSNTLFPAYQKSDPLFSLWLVLARLIQYSLSPVTKCNDTEK